MHRGKHSRFGARVVERHEYGQSINGVFFSQIFSELEYAYNEKPPGG
jgi:hypothetical protein